MKFTASDIIAITSILASVAIAYINSVSNARFSRSKDRLERKCKAYDDFYHALAIFSHPDQSGLRDFKSLTSAYYSVSMFASREIRNKIKSLLDAYLTLTEYRNKIYTACAANNCLNQFQALLNADTRYIDITNQISRLTNEVMDAIHNEIERLSK